MQKFIVSFLLVSGLLVCAGCGQFGKDDQELVQDAREYLEQREINAAAIELRNALQKNPDNTEARYLLGNINLDIGDFATAEKEFRRAFEAGWDEEVVLVGLANALLLQKNYAGVLSDIEIRDSFSVDTRANLYGLHAAAESGAGNADKAREMLAEGSRLDPGAVEIMKVTIQMQLEAGKQAEARDSLSRALVNHPDRPELVLLSARLAELEKNNAAAMHAYQQVIQTEPANFITFYGLNARLGLLRLQILADELEQAELTLKTLLSRSENNPHTNYLGGLLAMRQGAPDLAEERLLRVLKFAPDHAPTHLLFGAANFQQEDYGQATYFLEKYLAAVPDNLNARKMLGRSYMLLGQHDSALESMQPALGEKVDDAELLALVSLSELQKGETVSGIAGLEKAVAIDPDSIALRGDLARAYLATGETEQAVRELKEILSKGGEQKETKTLLVLAHLRAGEFEQAISVAQEMLDKNPEDPANNAFVANVFAASGNAQEARKYFERALQLEPGFPAATLSLARFEEANGNTDDAIALYEGLIGTIDKPEVPILALARLAQKQGNRQETESWLLKAVDMAPDQARPRAILARYYIDENQLVKARSQVVEAIALSPKEPLVLEVQGRLLVAEKQYRQALSPLAALIESKPDYTFARLILAETHIRLKQPEPAIAELNHVLTKQQNNMIALVLLARANLLQGNTEDALKISQRVQKEYPETYLGYEGEGDARTLRAEHDLASLAYKQAWKLRESPALALNLAQSMTRAGDDEAAINFLREWLERNPDDIGSRLFIGMTYQKLNQDDRAIEAYKKVLVAEPNNLIVLNNLAWLSLESDKQEALALAERAYQASPNSAVVVDTYGWILVQSDQAEKGLKLLEQAQEKLSHMPDVRYHYAVALLKTGAKDDARQILEELLNADKPFDGLEDARQILAELGEAKS